MPLSFSTPLRALRLASRVSTAIVRNEVAVGTERLSLIALASIAAGPRSGFASPGAAVGAGAAGAAPSPSPAAASTSALVTLPPAPDPFTFARSTPRSAAILRATGVALPPSPISGRVLCSLGARPEPSPSLAPRSVSAAAGSVAPWSPPASPGLIRASTAPTSTVSSGCAAIEVTTPLAGAGTSASTLSVDTSTIVAPSSIVSPSETCHSSTVPSLTDSPISGITTCSSPDSVVPPALTLASSVVAVVVDSESLSARVLAPLGARPESSSSLAPRSASAAGGWCPPCSVSVRSEALAPSPDAAAPFGSISASTCPTCTVSSGWARILLITPSAGAGTSASTLSVETSTTVCPSSTDSPSETCHSRTVPSLTDSPIWGIWISTLMPRYGV
jgi:hypothetical protein